MKYATIEEQIKSVDARWKRAAVDAAAVAMSRYPDAPRWRRQAEALAICPLLKYLEEQLKAAVDAVRNAEDPCTRYQAGLTLTARNNAVQDMTRRIMRATK